MNSKRTLLASFLGAFLGVGSALGQGLYGPQVTPQPASELAGAVPPNGAAVAASPHVGTPSGWHNWVVNHPCSCFGTNDGPPPVQYELFTRHGIGWSFGSSPFAEVLDPGYVFTGGARTLFFDHSHTRAWTVETSITNLAQNARANNQQIPLNTFVNVNNQAVFLNLGQGNLPGPTIHGLNRTFVNLGFGRENYVSAADECSSSTIRYGWDLGGRYGSARADFNSITINNLNIPMRRRTDVIGGMYFALHSDIEVPFYCTYFSAGWRGEYSHTWSDVLQQQSDLGDFTLSLNLGLRF